MLLYSEESERLKRISKRGKVFDSTLFRSDVKVLRLNPSAMRDAI